MAKPSGKIKFDKTNPEHVDTVRNGDVTLHSGGYFSHNKKPKLVKFDKTNADHVKAVQGEDVSLHSGGYFSRNTPAKKSTSDGGKGAVAKKVATPRKLKAVPPAEKPETSVTPVKKASAPAKKTATKKAAPATKKVGHVERARAAENAARSQGKIK